MKQDDATVRIALIHALEESVLPSRAAFSQEWPEAYCYDLLDSSLAVDLALQGSIDPAMIGRFEDLARYAQATSGKGGKTAGLLFTCSAFGPAIDRAKRQCSVPVLRPNEAAFEEALAMGSRIGLVVSFPPSLAAMEGELRSMAAEAGRQVTIKSALAHEALLALKAGDGPAHDRIVAESAASLGAVDALVLCQFSMARAAQTVAARCGVVPLTTPQSAVRKMKASVFAGRETIQFSHK
jgi:Asp/Glu/hydantoin racemase